MIVKNKNHNKLKHLFFLINYNIVIKMYIILNFFSLNIININLYFTLRKNQKNVDNLYILKKKYIYKHLISICI
jgi:hypothetical protein